MVEHSTFNFKIAGSNPAAGTGRGEMGKCVNIRHRNDTQHIGTQHCALAQNNETQNNDTQLNSIWDNNTQHSGGRDTQHIDTDLNDVQHNDTA